MYILYYACVWFITALAEQHYLFTTYQTFGVLIFRNLLCSKLKSPVIHIEQFGCIIFAKEKSQKKVNQSNEDEELLRWKPLNV